MLKTIASPVLWAIVGCSLGLYQGYNHGFRHGVTLMARATIEMVDGLNKPDDTDFNPPAKRRI